jgi:hypothetical protein
MKTFKFTLEALKRILPVFIVIAGILGSFPSTLVSNTQIRQEVNITDAYYYAGSGSYATSSEIAAITDSNYTAPSYYFEVDASTTSATNASVSLVNASSGVAVATVTITGGNTYTRYRSAQFLPNSSSTVEYQVQLNNEAVGKGILASRIIILQNAATLNKTETQIEIGNGQTFSANATSTLTSPKAWLYTAANWDGSPTFTAEVDYNILKGVASTTAFNAAGTFNLTNPAGVASTTIELLGGGGAGGGNTAAASRGGAGAAGGQYARSTTTANGSTHTLIVGATIAGGSGATGGNGKDSTWDATAVVAKGGTGGGVSTGATVATTSGSTTGCVGQTCFAGGSSGAGDTTKGGGGGGGAGTTGAGGSVPANGTTAGTGTAAGGGAGGAGTSSNAAGAAAAAIGGGGGGGSYTTAAAAAHAGGTGGAGRATTTNYIATTTIDIQEDNGSFAGWTDKATMVSYGSAGVATSTRARVSFTPTTGRHYRLAFKAGDSRTLTAIYDAKIIVDQTGGLANTAYAAKSFSFASQDTRPTGIFLSTDRTTMYMVGTTSSTVYQYSITAGDVSTASYSSKSFSVNSQDTRPNNIYMNSDGSKMYIMGSTTKTVYQYTLSTPGDVSTASYASKSFSVSTQSARPAGLAFNPDLSKMYVLDQTGNTVYQYTLSTPGDVSTASYASKSFSVNSQDAHSYGIYLSPNGVKLFMVGNNLKVYQYTLGTAYDISTAVYDGLNLTLSGQDSTTYQPVFSPDQSTLYILGQSNNSVYQYTVTTLSKLEPEYMVNPRLLPTGTSLQGFLTSWNSGEWSTNNSYFHQADASSSATSVVGIYTAGASLLTNSQISSPNYSTISSAMTMPSNGDLDVEASTNNNNITGDRILVDALLPVTTLANASDPGNATLAPGAAATLGDAFTLQTSVGTDAINAVTVSLGAGAHTGIQYVEITDANGQTTYGTSTTPSGDTPTIALTNLTASTALTTYKIRITPLSHANMPVPPGATYTVTAKINSVISSNIEAGSDTAGTTLTIDNQSPGDVTALSVVPGNTQATLSWNNPSDADLSKVMVVASTSAITFVPVEGTTYSTSTLNGASRVACYGLQYSCTDTSLSNGTSYFYEVFTTDSHGNWDVGVTPTPTSVTPYTITQESYEFYAATSTYEGQTWSSVTMPSSHFWSFVYGDGVFAGVVGGGTTNFAVYSSDGVNWNTSNTVANQSWSGAAYGNGTFAVVSVDGSGAGMTSTDGINWTAQTIPAQDWDNVAYGNGLFVSVDDNGADAQEVMTSPDGVTWTLQNIAQNKWLAVAYGDGKFVTVSNAQTGVSGDVATSPDGVTWTLQTIPSNLDLQGVAWDSTIGLFAAAATDGTILTSPDGVTWTARTPATASHWQGMDSGNGVFIAMGNSNAVNISYDGINWTSVTPPGNGTTDWGYAVYGKGIFLMADFINNTVVSSGFAGPHVGPALAAASTAATLSKSGQNFRLRLLNRADSGGYTRRSLPNLKLQYAVKSGTCDTAFSGETYADVTDTTPISYYDDPVYTNGDTAVSTTTDLTDGGRTIIYEPYRENNNFFATTTVASGQDGLWDFSLYDNNSGGGDYCLREVESTDAQTWVSRTDPTDNSWQSITYGNGTYVALSNGKEGTASEVMTSPDSITWTSRTASTNSAWRAVTYGNGLFVGVSDGVEGASSEVMTSPDGITWTTRTAAANDAWKSVTYGNGLFVAVAANGDAMTSPDGTTWTLRSTPSVSQWWGVTYGNGLFVAVSNGNEGVGTEIMTSADGIHWTNRTAAASNLWKSVVYGNGMFVAVAGSGTANRVMTSPDGVAWTSRSTSGLDSVWQSVTYGNGLFVAVSSGGEGAPNEVMTSPNGNNWSRFSAAANNTWLAATYGNGIFAAVSITGTSNRIMTASTSSSTLDVYDTNSIPEVVTAAGASVAQLHYAWRNDDGNEAAASFAAAQDTALSTGVYVGDRRRIRFLLSGTGTSNNYTYQLEQSSSTCTIWIAVPSTNTNSTHWVADLSEYFLNGAASTNNATLSDPVGKSFVASFAESGSTLAPAISLTSSQFTELEYTIKSTANVTPNTTYCFRVTNAGDASKITYTQTPQISVLPGSARPVSGGSSTEGSGSGPIESGGNEAGGGTGNSGNSGGEGNGNGNSQGGGNEGGGGGGDTGYVFPKDFFALFIQLPIDFTVDPLLSVKEQSQS